MESNEWKEYRFSELVEIIGGGTPKTNVEKYWNGDIPWLSVKDFNSDNRKMGIRIFEWKPPSFDDLQG
ncbi:restriction endonuclease subunit S [Caldifermentibacillus hisashii]|uniref:restriction endonuclease subunit S n=1 Tax=Caldifermentibacillus hisashii TaxID=996558 RepID=UPI0034D556D3